MKKVRTLGVVGIILVLVLVAQMFWLSHGAFAAPVISANQASQHIGQSVTVQGTVTQVYVSRKGNIFLNMGGRYPHNSFTAVIFREYASSFSNAGNLQGKFIRVKGRIKLYRERPEIILTSGSQIEMGR